MDDYDYHEYLSANGRDMVQHHHESGGVTVTTESEDVTQYPGSVVSIWRTYDEIGLHSITTGYCKNCTSAMEEDMVTGT